MEIVIKIDDGLYNQIFSDAEIMIYGGMRNGKTLLATLLRAIRNGIPLPKDATNGDVFMTMFPNLIWHSVRGDLIGKTSVDMPIGDRWQKNMFYCDTNWWEAPYTREESKE